MSEKIKTTKKMTLPAVSKRPAATQRGTLQTQQTKSLRRQAPAQKVPTVLD